MIYIWDIYILFNKGKTNEVQKKRVFSLGVNISAWRRHYDYIYQISGYEK